MVRPFFPYYGSKWNIARHYPPPEFGRVIEPFAGSAAYSTFYNCERVLLVDADPVLCETWRYLISASEKDIENLPLLPEVGDNVDNYDLSPGAKYLIGFWLNRGSATPKKSRTAYSARTDKAQLNWGTRAKERIVQQLPLIRKWNVISGPYTAAPDDIATWFIDPPYGDKGKFYRVKFAAFDQLGLWCRERRGRTIVCEGPGAKWLPFEPLGSFKTSNGKADEFVYIQEFAA